MKHPSFRMPSVDAFKAIASQLIVLHHLAAYGPLSEAVQEIAPELISWLYEYARMAVQVFLVIGGFLAARGLAPHGEVAIASPLALVWRRYLRLAVPYLIAVALAILAAALARHWMDDDSIPAAPTVRQWLAHALLLQSLLGYESLSAGVWYVAIDFQLFALMVGCLWLGRVCGLRQYAPAVLLVLALVALFWFNRHPEWDSWAIYFIGSYGLGAAAWWASERGRLFAWLGVIATVGMAALLLDFRLRLVLALAVALVLGFARRTGWLESWPESRCLTFLGRISYSVFLAHFPVCLLMNAVYYHYDFESDWAAPIGMLAAWGGSVLAGHLFYRLVESAAPKWELRKAVGSLLSRLPAPLNSPVRSGS